MNTNLFELQIKTILLGKTTHHGFSIILNVTHAPKVVDRLNVVKLQVGLSGEHP